MAKKVVFISILCFAVFFYIDELFFDSLRKQIFDLTGQLGISHIIAYSLVGIPLFAAILLLHKRSGFFDSLGLNRSALTGLIFAVACTAPMFVIHSLVYDFNAELSLNEILITGLAAGFFEELYFRGFLYGQLYRFTRLGFIFSALIAAIFYAALHLLLGSDIFELILVFVISFFGSLIFGWVYTEWHHNLWVPVFLHIFINLFWQMFAVEEDSYANWTRLFTLFIVIALTLLYKKRKGRSFEINWDNLFLKKGSPKELIPD